MVVPVPGTVVKDGYSNAPAIIIAVKGLTPNLFAAAAVSKTGRK